jgi:ABC-2 type transport system ATP-binding protein
MDEPVANLDPKARIDFFDKLLELKAKGKAIFVSSHVLAELDRYSDSVTVLDGGKIVYTGSKDALLKRFAWNRYLCETNNHAKTEKYLTTKHIKYDYDEFKNLIVHFENEKQIRDFQMKILNMKIKLLQFRRLEPTLDEIYKKLVIKGSVDTMGG